MGEYLCLTESDWKGGLPLLAKGGKADLSAAAALDLADATDPQKQAEVGDAWWSAADNEPEFARMLIRQRAATWYNKALESSAIQGLKRVLLERRVAAAESSSTAAAHGQLHATALPRVVIVSAEFGAGKRTASVAKLIQASLDADPFAPVAATSDALKIDPAPFVHKKLALSYRVGAANYSVEVEEGGLILVPPISKDGETIAGASIPFKIVAARYGVDDKWLDVTDAIRKEVKDPSEPVKIHNMADGRELHEGVPKRVVVYFEIHGRRFAQITDQGDSMTLISR